jgi:hypothetical protein
MLVLDWMLIYENKTILKVKMTKWINTKKKQIKPNKNWKLFSIYLFNLLKLHKVLTQMQVF